MSKAPLTLMMGWPRPPEPSGEVPNDRFFQSLIVQFEGRIAPAAEKIQSARKPKSKRARREALEQNRLLREGFGGVWDRDFGLVVVAAHGGIAVLPYQREVPFSEMWRQPLKWGEILRTGS